MRSTWQQHHLRAAEERDRPLHRLVGDDRVPDVGLAAQVRGRAAADDALSHARRGQEVRLQLDRRERRPGRDVVPAADRRAGVRKRDDGRREQEARAGDQVLGDVDVAQDEILGGVVEDVLYTHPKVGDCAVIGLLDRERGERVCAVVETAPGQEPLTLAEMVAWCKEAGLMTQKIPEQLEVVEQLPRNPTFKILKYKLRDEYNQRPAP